MVNKPVCRCENVGIEEILDAIGQGATTVDTVKKWTRAGMGRCQGRTCGPLIANIIAREARVVPEAVPLGRARPPVRPIRLGALAEIESGSGEWGPEELPLESAVAPVVSGQLSEKCEFVVVGAGAIGSSIAYHLCKLGRDVVVLDRQDLLQGTSGATQAWVFVHPKEPVFYMKLHWESARMFPHLSEELGIDVEYRRTGGMVGLMTPEELDHAKELVAANREAGLDVHLLTHEEAVSLEPGLSRKVIAATYSPIDGNVNPFRLVRGFIRKVSEMGGRVYLRTPVVGLRAEDGRGWVVSTGRGEVRCRVVIVAAGVRTAEVARLAGVEVPMYPSRGQVLVTEPMPPVVKFTHQGVRQNPTGEILLGYISESGGYRNVNTLAGMARVAREAMEYMPFLADVFVIRAYSGLRPMPRDKMPIMSWARREPPLFIAVTHSGIVLSPVLGRLVAHSLTSGKTVPELEPFRLDRFRG